MNKEKKNSSLKNIGIFLLFVSMALFYWGYHESQQISEPVAGLLQKDSGDTRDILYINIAAAIILLIGGYLSMDEYR